MRISAVFTSLALLAGGVNGSRADDYWSGYLYLDHHYARIRLEDNGKAVSSWSQNRSDLGAAMQYRLDACAVGLNVSELRHANTTYDDNPIGTSITAEGGCRVSDLWIVGLGRYTKVNTWETEMRAYGGGLSYFMTDRLRMAVSAEQRRYSGAPPSEWMIYTAKSSYFLTDDLMLSSSLEFDQSDVSRTYSLFSDVEYKLKERPVSFYAGLMAGSNRTEGSNVHGHILGAQAGLRFFFNDGSLKTILDNSMPDFGH